MRPYRSAKFIGALAVIYTVIPISTALRDISDSSAFHSLRHSLASTLLANNVPMPVISEIMNHANTETTNIYYKIDFSHLKECALDVDFDAEVADGE